ncbi:MAG: hypothetical protein J2P26_12395, partial [Nocardiopsaceae bacterium]|nr:hypothetical protein [Nocardiopsaceae bacterium]
MPEKVTISHRGARYEIGRGKRYYGIWVTGAPESDPVDRWPETTDGWAQAWTRFVTLETPRTITAVDERTGFRWPRAAVGALWAGWLRAARLGMVRLHVGGPGSAGGLGGRAAPAAAGLLGLGVLIGVIGLFPDYSGASLVSDPVQWVPHLLYLIGWAASAALIVGGVRRARSGRVSPAGRVHPSGVDPAG